MSFRVCVVCVETFIGVAAGAFDFWVALSFAGEWNCASRGGVCVGVVFVDFEGCVGRTSVDVEV